MCIDVQKYAVKQKPKYWDLMCYSSSFSSFCHNIQKSWMGIMGFFLSRLNGKSRWDAKKQIMQNESEICQNQFSYFLTEPTHNLQSKFVTDFPEKCVNWFQRIQVVKGLQKQKEYRNQMVCLPILKSEFVSANSFCYIFEDHITYKL